MFTNILMFSDFFAQTGKEPITLSVFFYAATDGQGVIQPVVESGPNGLRLTKIQGMLELGLSHTSDYMFFKNFLNNVTENLKHC